MKKLTLVMLAVISMALVSCGGGNKHKTLAESVREREEKEKAVLDAKLYEPATPAINYGKALPDEKDSFFSLRDYFEVKSVALSQTDETTVPSYVIATVTLEALEDAPEDFNYIYGKITLFDENMLEIKSDGSEYKRTDGTTTNSNDFKKGDVCRLSANIHYQERNFDVLSKAKYVQINYFKGFKYTKQ